MVQQLVDSGQITREQAALHPQKNLITRALGVSANIVPEYNRCEVVPGDLLLLLYRWINQHGTRCRACAAFAGVLPFLTRRGYWLTVP